MADRRIENTKAYIDNHFTQKISMEVLTSVAYVSTFHLSRLFSSTVGLSITAYIQQKRIEFAQELLCTTDLSVPTFNDEVRQKPLQVF